jgi:hypothetical protein
MNNVFYSPYGLTLAKIGIIIQTEKHKDIILIFFLFNYEKRGKPQTRFSPNCKTTIWVIQQDF